MGDIDGGDVVMRVGSNVGDREEGWNVVGTEVLEMLYGVGESEVVLGCVELSAIV